MQTYYENIITYILGDKNKREKRADNPKSNYWKHFICRFKTFNRSCNPMAVISYATYRKCKREQLIKTRKKHGQDTWQIGKKQMINLLLETKNPRCPMCHQAFTEKNPYTVDHIIRLVDGGTSHFENLQLLHRDCHNKKEKMYDRQKNNKKERITGKMYGKLAVDGAKKKKVKKETLPQEKLLSIDWAKLKELNS